MKKHFMIAAIATVLVAGCKAESVSQNKQSSLDAAKPSSSAAEAIPVPKYNAEGEGVLVDQAGYCPIPQK
jgi:protein involved in sex pheromone biosynthesis